MAGPTDSATTFGFTFGASHTQSTWGDARRVSWPAMVEMLTAHVPGSKEGNCIVPAIFSGDKRKKEEATQIDVAFLDSDSGTTLDEITAALNAKGWEAVVSSTHSHMTTQTDVSVTNWDRYFAKNNDATPADFLRDEKGYLAAVAEGAEVIGSDEKYIHLQHAPCPKFRIALPLKQPWRAADYPDQATANAAWKERIEALASALDLPHDQACTDTSRLFYLPRRPIRGAIPETAVVAGSFCDVFSLPSAAAPGLFEQPKGRPQHADALEYADPITGEFVDLTSWAKGFGRTFLIAKALRERKPGVITGLIVDNCKVHIDCPNGATHTSAGRDNASFVVNAGNGGTEGFVVHCRHAHCTGKDRLFFVRRMLEERWLGIDDLTAAEFHNQRPKPEPATPDHADTNLPLVYFDDIEPCLDVRDFVQGVLVEEGSAVVYGESNAGKTFWTTDLALHVAAGREWNGRRVEQGGVIYCVLEGGAGFKNRVAAWRNETLERDIPFAAIPVTLNLLDTEADTPKLIEAIRGAAAKMGQPVKLVVVDTLSRAMAGGNENAPDDMGALVRNMDQIRQATGACLLFVHHSGKDAAKGARGHSLLRAAIDTEIEVVAGEGEGKAATVVKQRELKKGDVFEFVLKVVELGMNRHGEAVTTCLVDGANVGEARAYSPKRSLKGHPKRAYEILENLVSASGRMGDAGVPSGYSSVPEKWWRDQFYENAMAAADTKTKEKAFRRAADGLVENHIVGMATGRVWIVRQGKS